MSRLTRRCVEKPYATRLYGAIGKPCNDIDYLEKVYNKLGQLEDLEEELGCQLEVIKKLRKANYIYRDDGVGFGFIGINFNDEDKLILYNDDECNTFTSDLRLADYKKTWWLKEDKSE